MNNWWDRFKNNKKKGKIIRDNLKRKMSKLIKIRENNILL